MKTKSNDAPENIVRFICGKQGHKSYQCHNEAKNRWCIKCRTNTNFTSQCRRRDATKAIADEKTPDILCFDEKELLFLTQMTLIYYILMI
jgi:hypothetical protein